MKKTLLMASLLFCICVQAQTTGEKTETTSEQVEKLMNENWVQSLSVNDAFNATDLEISKRLKNNLYIGLSTYYSFTGTPSSSGLYPYLAYRQPLDKDARRFFIWGNAGYNFTFVSSYKVGNTFMPSTTTSGFLWELGADYFFTKDLGVTVYAPELKGVWFGVVVRGSKFF